MSRHQSCPEYEMYLDAKCTIRDSGNVCRVFYISPRPKADVQQSRISLVYVWIFLKDACDPDSFFNVDFSKDGNRICFIQIPMEKENSRQLIIMTSVKLYLHGKLSNVICTWISLLPVKIKRNLFYYTWHKCHCKVFYK